MTLTKTELKREDFRYYKRTKLSTLIELFLNSHENVMEVTDHDYKNAASGLASIGKHVRKFKEPVEVHTKENHIYLIKKDI